MLAFQGDEEASTCESNRNFSVTMCAPGGLILNGKNIGSALHYAESNVTHTKETLENFDSRLQQIVEDVRRNQIQTNGQSEDFNTKYKSWKEEKDALQNLVRALQLAQLNLTSQVNTLRTTIKKT